MMMGRATRQNTTPCPLCSPPEDHILRRGRLVLAVSDGFPVSEGHALVLPQRHVASLYDLEAEERFVRVSEQDGGAATNSSSCWSSRDRRAEADHQDPGGGPEAIALADDEGR